MLWVQFPPRVPKLAPVAQLEEVADLKSVCCGFDSHQEYQRDVIQWREAMLWEHGVAGSSPAIPICRYNGTGIRAGIRVRILQVQFLSGVPKYLGVAQLETPEFRELQVAGSIPATQTLPL